MPNIEPITEVPEHADILMRTLPIIAGRRIAVFLPDLRGGGAERAMLNIAKAFTEYGANVDIVLSEKVGEYLPQIPPSLRVVDLGVRRTFQSLIPLVKYLKESQPAVLISALSHANMIALVARNVARSRTKVIICLQNTMGIETESEISRHQKILPAITRRFAPEADAIVAVSQGVADDFTKLIGIDRNRIDVIYNPVVSEDMLAKAAESLSHPWFQPGQPPVILAVGRLNPQKDFTTLIKAFSIVKRRRLARLLILGQGEERSRLETLVNELALGEDVSLPGFASNPFAYMSRAAVFALSSRFEGLPTVLIEALVCGCPVVATDCPSGPSEILAGIPTGRLTPVGDPDALAAALLNVLDEPKNVLNRETWDCYTLPVVAKQYAATIERIAPRDISSND